MQNVWRRLDVFISMALLLGCSSPQIEETDIGSFPFANSNLLVHSIADSCISVIDTETPELIGSIKNRYFRPALEFEVTSDGNLYLPLNGDYNTTENEVILLSLEDGSHQSITVNDGPEKVWQGNEYSLLSHNVILPEAPGELFDMTVMSADGSRQLYSERTHGAVEDAVINGSTAYIALQNFRNGVNHKIVEYDLAGQRQLRSFPLPAAPVKLILSSHTPDVLYVTTLRPKSSGDDVNTALSEVIEIQLATNSLRTITKLKWPRALLEVDKDYLLITENRVNSGNYLRKVNIETGHVELEKDVGSSPLDLVAISETMVAVSIVKESKVLFIDPSTLKIENEVQLTCRRPHGMKLYRP